MALAVSLYSLQAQNTVKAIKCEKQNLLLHTAMKPLLPSTTTTTSQLAQQ